MRKYLTFESAELGRNQHGFTLIELLVVFSLIGLMVGIVPIAFDRMRESAQYRDVLRTMLSDIRLARYRAVSEGKEVTLNVDLEKRRFGLNESMHALPASLQIRATVAGQELALNGIAAVRFLPDGGASGGRIDIVRAAGTGTRLQIDWLSGRVNQEPLRP